MTTVMSREELAKKFGYNWVGSFSEGLAAARKDGKDFHIRPDGTPAYEQRYDWVGSFSEGQARACENGKEIRIRPDGTRVE